MATGSDRWWDRRALFLGLLTGVVTGVVWLAFTRLVPDDDSSASLALGAAAFFGALGSGVASVWLIGRAAWRRLGASDVMRAHGWDSASAVASALTGALSLASGLWFVSLLHEPEDGTDSVGMLLMSSLLTGMASGVTSVSLLAFELMRRRRSRAAR